MGFAESDFSHIDGQQSKIPLKHSLQLGYSVEWYNLSVAMYGPRSTAEN